MKMVNIIIGRFQPLTNGHMQCIEDSYEETNNPTIICMIDVKDNKVDLRHPFPSSMLTPIYKDALKHNKMVEDIILVNNADIVKIGEELYKKGYQISSWTCGTDRLQSYSKMADKYHDQAHLSENFKMIEIKRGDEDISATKVREAILADDYKTFAKMTPLASLKSHVLGKNYYNILREQLLKVV